MIQGYNHNVRYGGRVFHVQTEDSGLANPHIITHCYHGGTIVASKKTGYADILTHERRDDVIREIMKEQHRQMLLDLRDGRLDPQLVTFGLPPEQGGQAVRAPADNDTKALDDILLDYLASRTAKADPKR
jgi:hypothetical protein